VPPPDEPEEPDEPDDEPDDEPEEPEEPEEPDEESLLEAAAGVDEGVDEPLLGVGVELESAAFDSGLLDAYRSLYQPPPLSENAVREISFSSAGLPQTSQSTRSSSTIRCWTSNSRPQALHLYS